MTPRTPADTRVAFGQKLRQARRDKGLSQTEVADKIGTDQKVVSRAELGKATIETQLRIAAELGVTLVEAAASS